MNNPTRSKMNNQITIALAVIGAILTLGFCWIFGHDLPLENKLLSIVLGGTSMIPMLLFLRGQTYTRIPIFAMNCLFYFVAFAVNGFFFLETDVIALSNILPSSYFTGLMIGLTGLLSQMAGYYLCTNIITNRKPIRAIGHMRNDRVRAMAWTFIAIRVFMLLVPSVNEIPTVKQFLVIVPFAGLGLLMMCDIEGKLSVAEKVLYYLAIPVELFLKLATGAVYEPVLLAFFLFFVRWVLTGKIYYAWVVTGFIFFLIFNPVKERYRDVVWRTESGKNMASFDKIMLFISVAGDYWAGDSANTTNVSSNLRTRLNHLAIASHVSQLTPYQIPYWNGQTLSEASTSFIPRILWPDKPNLVYGVDFAHRYGFTHFTNMNTTVNITWTVELYANFGFLALICGMFIVGICFQFIERWIATPGTTKIDMILPLSSIFPLFYPESNIILMWSSVITSNIALYSIAFCFKTDSLS